MLTGLVSTHRPAFWKIAMVLTTYTDYTLRVLIRLAAPVKTTSKTRRKT
jgi:hypothetical protein